MDMQTMLSSLNATKEQLGKLRGRWDGDLKKLHGQVAQLNVHAKEMDEFKKDMYSQFTNKMRDQREDYAKRIQEAEGRANERMSGFKSDVGFKFDQISKEVEKAKSYSTQLWEMTKVAATEMVEGEISRVSEVYEKVKNELIHKTDDILKRNKKSISNIKNSWASFFDKYDKALSYMQRRFDNINETFTNYEKNTFQPVQVREARLHYIESQLKEQEKTIETEHEFFKDIMKKLLFALESSVLVNGLDHINLTKRSKENASSEERNRKVHRSSASKFDGNKSMIEPTGETFLPSLTRNISMPKNIKDDSGLPSLKISSKPHISSQVVSPRSKSIQKLAPPIDAALKKRILFLSDSLDRNPHLTTKNTLKVYEQISPKESLHTLVKVAEPQIRSFFQTPSVNSLMSSKIHSQAIFRQVFGASEGRFSNHL
jgi:hypothetical protein